MQTIKTLTLIAEMETDGHSPLKFLCEDFNVYYAKYRTASGLKKEEIDCLFYEVVCSKLLSAFAVPTPELAIIQITAGSYDKNQLKRHKMCCKPGTLYLGSKNIEDTDLVHGIIPVNTKRDFNKLENPYDLIKIALFDLWVNNCDRGFLDNYNLLIQYNESSSRFYAFDHAFCFGGLNQLRIFNSGLPMDNQNKLFRSTYFKKIFPFFDKHKVKDIVDNFVYLLPHETNEIISLAYDECPEVWGIPSSLKDRMFAFLTNANRIAELKQTILSLLK